MNVSKSSLIVLVLLSAALLFSQTSCGGGSRSGTSSGGAKSVAAKGTSTRLNPRTTVYVGDDVTVVRHAGRTYVKARDDDNGDGVPDDAD